jgi:hypothetical protein
MAEKQHESVLRGATLFLMAISIVKRAASALIEACRFE